MPKDPASRNAPDSRQPSRQRALNRKPQPARAKLSRKVIIRAALRLIDENGADALNMRDLGTALGASTMSVYRHFRNKAELLDAVVDRVIDGLVSEIPERSWQAEARVIALRVRSAILVHPHLAEFMGRELRRSAVSLRVNAEVIDRLRASGVPDRFLSETFWALASYANGYALLEAQALKHGRTQSTLKRRQQRLRKFIGILEAVDDIPKSSIVPAASVLSRPLDEDQFLFGLDCLIQGLERKFRS